ncbi:Pyrophosphatase PpaX [compost metagenome]
MGDELRDVQACKRIGVKVAAVTWGYDSVKLLTEAEPDYLCEAPVDILGLIADHSWRV